MTNKQVSRLKWVAVLCSLLSLFRDVLRIILRIILGYLCNTEYAIRNTQYAIRNIAMALKNRIVKTSAVNKEHG